MFDGNFRSTQRRKPTASSRGRASILEKSRRERENRLKDQQRQTASKTIQRYVRGHLCRCQTARMCENELQQNHDQLPYNVTLLNMRLRLPGADNDIEKYASGLLLKQIRDYGNERRMKNDSTRKDCPLANRLVKSLLIRLQREWCDWIVTIISYCVECSDIPPMIQIGSEEGLLLLFEATTKYKNTVLAAILRACVPDSREAKALLEIVPFFVQSNDETLKFDNILYILQHADSRNGEETTKQTITLTVLRYIDGMKSSIVKRVLENSTDVSTTVTFLRYLLKGDLLCLTGYVVAHGTVTVDDLTRLQDTMYMDIDDDGSDDSEDDDSIVDGQRPVVTVKKRTISGQYTKDSLSTVSKLDRIFRDRRMRQERDMLHPDRISKDMLDVASRLGSPQLWLEWRIKMMDDGIDDYIELLDRILRYTTSLHSRSSGTSLFLSKLAFNSDFIPYFWSLLIRLSDDELLANQSASCINLFCDVVSHHLLALKDDQFLEFYTGENCRVDASQLVTILRSLLYNLYWIRPVTVTSFQATFTASDDNKADIQRSRLLLSATKSWNALYERWSRLASEDRFCDENAWWFSSTSPLTGDNAIVESHNLVVNAQEPSFDDDGDQIMTIANSETDSLADAFSDPRMARILAIIPQALPFARRVKLFNSLLKVDKFKTQNEESEMQAVMLAMMRGSEEAMGSNRERVHIHRDKMYNDSMKSLNGLGKKLKKRVQVTFSNKHGVREAGIDGGGVFKEFIDDLIKDAFLLGDGSTAQYELFTITPVQALSVNVALSDDEEILPHYEFLGRVLGKAVYESILVEPQFCLPFLNQMLGKTNSLDDLKNLDPEYHRNLVKLLSLSDDEIRSLDMTFEMTFTSQHAQRTVNLIPNGSEVMLTKDNVVRYVHLVAHQRLNVFGQRQVKHFLKGFRDLIPASWVRLFSAYELQKLIGGDDSIRGIDVESFKSCMNYAAGYHPSQPIVQWFWEIVEDMTPDQQSKLLKFMTSCSRQPLLGFSSLEPIPCIQQIRISEQLHEQGSSAIPLPTSSTCMNLLKLPAYRTKEMMRSKLLLAIESGSGFELT